MNIIRLDKTESTNTYLKNLASEGCPSGTAVIAKIQTAGRGRYGKSFSSPEGGLYLSYLHNVEEIPEDLPVITEWTAVSVRRAIESVCGVEADIKYINDLLYRGKKLCGILTELRERSIIVGIGINVNSRTEDFGEDLRDTVTSIYEITGKKTDMELLERAVIGELALQFEDWPDKAWRMDYYLENAINQPKT